MGWLKEFARSLTKVAGSRSGVVRVLAVMQRNSDSQALAQIAGKARWHLEFAPSYDSAMELVRRERFHAILYDRDLTVAAGWREGISKLVSQAPESSIILASRVNDDYLWQEVIQLGGYDVLTKPFEAERVQRSVQFAWASRQPNLKRYP